jgi:hypothetical protein
MKKRFKYKPGDILERCYIQRRGGDRTFMDMFVIISCNRNPAVWEYLLYNLGEKRLEYYKRHQIDHTKLVCREFLRNGKRNPYSELLTWRRVSRKQHA